MKAVATTVATQQWKISKVMVGRLSVRAITKAEHYLLSESTHCTIKYSLNTTTMKQPRKHSIANLILYFIVWSAVTGLFLRIFIPQLQGKLSINGMLLIVECVLLFFSIIMVYWVFFEKRQE